jgi:hypothetical protein
VRVQASKALRVGPGDKIVIRGRLPPQALLGRLFVFASENGSELSPYVPRVADMLVDNGRPQMLKPMSLRLLRGQPTRELSFVSDIDGLLCVMQEVDSPSEPKADVRIQCQINPELPWNKRLLRKMAQWRLLS